VKFPRRRRPGEDPRQPDRRRDAGEARLWPFGAALGAGFLAAGLRLAGLTWLAWALLHHPKVSHAGVISVHDAVGVLQLVFASVAGAGALVALIVAYRRQKTAEADSAHDRTRVFNERFTAIAAQLGDAQAAVRLAGVHAMAGLADDRRDHRQDHRQTCVDVLCAYLRMPYEPEPYRGEDAPTERLALADSPGDADPGLEKRLAFQASREVRHTVIRVITAHLNGTAPVSWSGLNFDFTGVVFDGGDFDHAAFSGGTVSFRGATFSGGTVSFRGATFSGGTVSFDSAAFSGRAVNFGEAEFSGGVVSFDSAKFSRGLANFRGAEFSGGAVSFGGAAFSGGTVGFAIARFSGSEVSFNGAGFSGGLVNFGATVESGERGTFEFGGAAFSGGTVDFGGAGFSGGEVNFRNPNDWSHPPAFGQGFDESRPPPGVTLPAATGP
jgi:uncharacterized protein YjbI with pentapeptide repeats